MIFRTILVALVFTAGPALAQQVVELKPGPGQDVASVRCAACHSLNYIRMNSPFLSPDGWKAEVGKMRKVFGAPMEDAEEATIISYLVANYGAPAK
ncbi:MAG: hypothetical protein ABS99_05950 [Acetobacteraceae bacterium SCN 69-10]|nr:hypothetical protein [Rhodospirillales bacterium]ODU56369.1 MAG: hypothetical protein ABS99_05950 [Acetobacteraceae bacterium SCN 69-10]OJY65082.1 MAG: hypothetical protein BGP12_05005 [Rhodospirillales bacterium 70-18]